MNSGEMKRANDMVGILAKVLPVDGYVVRKVLDDFSLKGTGERLNIGCVKFSSSMTLTRIETILWEVGRSGKVSPLGVVSTVKVAGTNIGKVTLHNYQFVVDRGLGHGSVVGLRKAGLTIPALVFSAGNRFKPPSRSCHSCHQPMILRGKEMLCLNESCPARLSSLLTYLMGRKVMNIRGMSSASVRELVERNRLPINLLRMLAFPRVLAKEMLRIGFGRTRIDSCRRSCELIE